MGAAALTDPAAWATGTHPIINPAVEGPHNFRDNPALCPAHADRGPATSPDQLRPGRHFRRQCVMGVLFQILWPIAVAALATTGVFVMLFGLKSEQ